jgi:energy-converting hydrogenase Eha subunit F
MLKRLWSGLFILMSASILMACAQPTKLLIPPPPPKELMVLCQPLTPLSDGTGGTVLKKVVEISGQYYSCAEVHNELVKALNEPSRIGKQP